MSTRLKVEKKKFLRNFFVKAVICYIVWQVFYILILRPDGNVDDFLTHLSIIGTVSGFNFIGVDSYNIDNIIYINNIAAIRLENVCNGLELIALYTGFLICFPGNLKFKVIYGVIGSIILLIINVIREMFLAVNFVYFNKTFEINHKYTYTILVYIVVFLLWKHWVNHHSFIAVSDEKDS